MAEHKPDPKNELLSELESIKGLLNEQNADSLPDLDQIPVLCEVIESIEPLPEDRPHQSPLFPDVGAKRQPSNRPVQAKGENPFLPPHIRARLQGNKPAQPWLQSTAYAEKSTAHSEKSTAHAETSTEEAEKTSCEQEPGIHSSAKRAELIEALIAEFLPPLEARLKARLEAMTDEQLEVLRS